MKIKIQINDALEEFQVNQRLSYLKINRTNNSNNEVTKYQKYVYLNVFENSFTMMNFLENSNGTSFRNLTLDEFLLIDYKNSLTYVLCVRYENDSTEIEILAHSKDLEKLKEYALNYAELLKPKLCKIGYDFVAFESNSFNTRTTELNDTVLQSVLYHDSESFVCLEIYPSSEI